MTPFIRGVEQQFGVIHHRLLKVVTPQENDIPRIVNAFHTANGILRAAFEPKAQLEAGPRQALQLEATRSGVTTRRSFKGPAERFNILVGDQNHDLTYVQYKLLRVLAAQQGVISLNDLSTQVWGTPQSYTLVTKAISVLREKIEPDKNAPTFIRNSHGQGYYFQDREGKIVLPEETQTSN